MEALDVDMTARVGQHEGDMQCPACPSTWRTTVKGHEIESFQQPKGPKIRGLRRQTVVSCHICKAGRPAGHDRRGRVRWYLAPTGPTGPPMGIQEGSTKSARKPLTGLAERLTTPRRNAAQTAGDHLRQAAI